jgi:hypothetical protein
MSAKVCMEKVLTILLVSVRYSAKISYNPSTLRCAQLKTREELGQVPADFLLFRLRRQPDEPSLIRAQVLRPAGRDLLDSIGAPHSDQGISVGHTVEDGWKEAGIRHDLIYNLRNPPYGTSITALKLPEEDFHDSAPEVLVATPMANAMMGITRYRSAISPK